MGILKSIKEFFLGKDEAQRPAAQSAPRPAMRPLPPPRPGMARPGSMPPRPITPIYRPLPPGARPVMRPLPPPRPGMARPAVFAPPYSAMKKAPAAKKAVAKKPAKKAAKKKAAPKRKKRR